MLAQGIGTVHIGDEKRVPDPHSSTHSRIEICGI